MKEDDVTYVEDKLGISKKYKKALGTLQAISIVSYEKNFLRTVLLSSIHWDQYAL